MKAFALLVLTVLLPSAIAYMPEEPRPHAAASPEGRYVVRVMPATSEERAMATVYELTPEGIRYEKSRAFSLVHRNEPADVFITDKGDVYTFDDWGREGRQIAVVRYSADGKKPKVFTMGKLFPAPQLTEIERTHRVRGPINWRGEGPYGLRGGMPMSEVLVVPDVLGGHLVFSGEDVEYEPAPAKER
jgi:hypothetical protein